MGFRAVAILFFLLLSAAHALGQQAGSSELTGTVYDPYGAVVVGAKVTAVAADGKKFTTVTNDEGSYRLTLPYQSYFASRKFKMSKYDVIVESLGFRRSETKGYAYIPSQFGKMTLDIALEVEGFQDSSHP